MLKDEIATALLDTEPVTSKTLHLVTTHVAENVGSSSCILDMIDLSFVYGSPHSYEKFLKVHIFTKHKIVSLIFKNVF